MFNFSILDPIANYRRKLFSCRLWKQQPVECPLEIRRNKGAYLTNCFACTYVWLKPFDVIRQLNQFIIFIIRFAFLPYAHTPQIIAERCLACVIDTKGIYSTWRVESVVSERWLLRCVMRNMRKEQFVFDKRSAKLECDSTHHTQTNARALIQCIRDSVAFYKSNEDYSTNNNS